MGNSVEVYDIPEVFNFSRFHKVFKVQRWSERSRNSKLWVTRSDMRSDPPKLIGQ